jgi:hypothetical protein
MIEAGGAAVPVLEQARQTFLKDGSHAPIILGNFGGKITVCLAELAGPEDKDALAGWLARNVREGVLREYILIVESWTGEGPDALEWLARHGSIADMPGRTEALCACYGGPEGDAAWMARITREPLALGGWEPVEMPSSPLCRFGGLFRRSEDAAAR